MIMVPLSLAHIDGAMNRIDKSSLMRKLEKSRIKSGALDKKNINVCLIDFIYFLQMLSPQLPAESIVHTLGYVTYPVIPNKNLVKVFS